MKKFIINLLTCIFILNTTTTVNSATFKQDPNYTVIYQNDIITIESTLTIHTPQIQTFTSPYSKTSSKTYTIKNNYGSILATFTLNGTFTYNGISAECIKATYNSSISNHEWSFTARTARKNKNNAIGSFILTCDKLSQTISETLTLTYTADGTIS